MMRHATCVSIAVTLILAPTPGLAADAPQLQVAMFQADVTLPLGSLLYVKPLETIEHPLLAKGVVLADGTRRYVLCAVDWCTMRNATHDIFRRKLAAAAETEVAYTAVQCVHQHTAPPYDAGAQQLLDQQPDAPAYRDLEVFEQITDRVAEAVRQSLKQMRRFDMVGLSETKVDRVASIRRVFTDDGKLLTRWSACRDAQLRGMPEGPIDPLLKTITLGRQEKPIVRLHYYATHPQTYYRDGRASYDFPGMARQRLEQQEAVFQIYFTGCAGDVTAGKYNNGTPQARAELAERLFAAMQAATQSVRWTPVSQLVWRSVPLKLVARTDDQRARASSQAVLEDPQAESEKRIQAASRLATLDRLQQPIAISALRLGPAYILHLPGEPMIAFQRFAQQCRPADFVAVAGYGLATPGYVCTEEAFRQGGYEPSASDVVPESEQAVKQAMRAALGVE